eukprot:2575159-Rhodomonas_salina.1
MRLGLPRLPPRSAHTHTHHARLLAPNTHSLLPVPVPVLGTSHAVPVPQYQSYSTLSSYCRATAKTTALQSRLVQHPTALQRSRSRVD